VDLLLVVALATGTAAVATPSLRAVATEQRGRQAAAFLAAEIASARQAAIHEGRSVGVVFDSGTSGWAIRTCADGNGNGLRRAEVAAGSDPCLDGSQVLDALFAGVRVAVDPSVRGPEGEPGSADPVRVGRANIVSVSPAGTSTPGSVFFQAGATHWLVRFTGGTSRIRIFRLRSGASTWQRM
jgi:type II secretory pathway pseudopilin PulG